MTVDLDSLEAAAKAATGCRWSKGYKSVYADTGDEVASCTTDRIITNRQAEANAAFIAAANPAVVLELIAELRKARAERDWLANDIATKDGNCPPILQDCTGIVCTTDVCKQCWLNAAREAVEGKQ